MNEDTDLIENYSEQDYDKEKRIYKNRFVNLLSIDELEKIQFVFDEFFESQRDFVEGYEIYHEFFDALIVQRNRKEKR